MNLSQITKKKKKISRKEGPNSQHLQTKKTDHNRNNKKVSSIKHIGSFC